MKTNFYPFVYGQNINWETLIKDKLFIKEEKSTSLFSGLKIKQYFFILEDKLKYLFCVLLEKFSI